ncbi:MAG TPA: GNAT family N-acetyltransferase [Allosphingosinicella sp.]|jgi:ribosomal-protein-alanine N-acetyltransferase|nr:GNAT family N-acetyltransferase [Allosphingosinicella sp.]
MSGGEIELVPAGLADLDAVMTVMEDSFEPRYGEAWTALQVAGLLPMPGVWLILARRGGDPVGFGLARLVADEAELLLLAVRRAAQRQGIAKILLADFEAAAAHRGARRLHLEVRDGNHAVKIYERAGFAVVARRRNYYKGRDGYCFDALTLAKASGGSE